MDDPLGPPGKTQCIFVLFACLGALWVVKFRFSLLGPEWTRPVRKKQLIRVWRYVKGRIILKLSWDFQHTTTES
jgi:hypothetical protein